MFKAAIDGCQEYTAESRAFMGKILENSGVGEDAYMPDGETDVDGGGARRVVGWPGT